MNYLQRELARAETIKAQRAAAQATETIEQAQAALADAQARYDNYPTSRNAYRIAAAKDRVAAARERENSTVMTWVHAYGAWVNVFAKHQGNVHSAELEETAYQASEAAKLAWEAVEAKLVAAHVGRQVEALTPLQSLAEWAATPNGQEYMDLPPDGDLVRELRKARMI